MYYRVCNLIIDDLKSDLNAEITTILAFQHTLVNQSVLTYIDVRNLNMKITVGNADRFNTRKIGCNNIVPTL